MHLVVDSLRRPHSLLVAGATGVLLAACSVATSSPPPDPSFTTTTGATSSTAVSSSAPSDSGVVAKLCPLPPALGPALDSSWRRKAPGDGSVFAGSGRIVNDIPVILLREDNQRVALVDLETGEIKRVLARYPRLDPAKAPPRVIYPATEGQGFNPPFNWRDGIISGLSTMGQLILDTQSLRYLLIPETGSGGWSPRGLELMRYSSSGDASKALPLSELRQLLACP